MFLSIITPCYNAGKYIEEAIQSVLIQNNSNVELIIVDDGSIDNTADICKKYIGKNVNYIKTENKGAGHARNIGIKNAKGKWISFLDSDDLYLKNSLNEKTFSLLKKYEKEGVNIIYTPRIRIDMNLNTRPQVKFPEDIDKIQNYMPMLEFWTCIYSASFLKENNILFYEYKKQDIETAFRFKSFYKANKIIKNNSIKFYLQRDNLESNTHTWNLYNLYEIKAKVYYDLYKQIKDENYKSNKYLLEIVIENISKYFSLCLLKGINNKDELNNLKLILNEISKVEENKYFIKKIRIKYSTLSIIDYVYNEFKNYMKSMLKYKKYKIISENDIVKSTKLDDILTKLEDISVELIGKC